MTWPILIVAHKELVDVMRDRRSMATLVLTGLFGPLMIGLMLRHQAAIRSSVDHLVVPIVSPDRAPMLVDWLKQQYGVEVVPEPADPETAIRSGQSEVVLMIDDDFGAAFAGSRPAKVRVLADDARPLSGACADRLVRLLGSYGDTIATSRLIVRGVSPDAASPLDLDRRDIATSEERGAMALNGLLLFLSLAVLTAGMQIATDSTAGERERGSLEPLLLNPVARWQIVGGKWLAALLWASASLLATLVVLAVIVSRLPLDVLGIRLHLDAATGLLLVAAMWPLAMLAPAIQIYLGCFARSFKEAQSYSVFLVLPVAALGILSIVAHVATGAWMNAVPILAQYAMGSQVLGGRVPPAAMFVTAAAEGALVTLGFLVLATRLFASERMIMRV